MESQVFAELQAKRALAQEKLAIITRAEASIKPLVDPARAELHKLENSINELATPFLREVGLEGLSDPLTALEVYRAGWARGLGNNEFEDALRELLQGTYLHPSWEWRSVSERDYEHCIPALQIAIPLHLEEEVLERTAQVLETVYLAQVELLEDMRVRVDNGSEYVTLLELGYQPATKSFSLWEGYNLQREGDLREVLSYMAAHTRYLDHKGNVVRDEDQDY